MDIIPAPSRVPANVLSEILGFEGG